MKKLITVRPAPEGHWVGDGFPVRTLFGPNTLGGRLSPFLMLDYAGPAEFKPTDERLGVDEHPHKGFETVTIVYSGGVEHRDSAGNAGKIGPGDVQWMTAASGVVHEEKHSAEFARDGGIFQMLQLWVNLPAKDKKSPPRYQELLSTDIPSVQVGGGSVRVIAGSFDGRLGPAKTFTPMNVFDVQLSAGSRLDVPLIDGHSALVTVLEGRITVDGQTVEPAALAVFEHEGNAVSFEAVEDSKVIVLSGEPIDEPIAAYGPFVMNTQEEIQEAFEEYRTGKMGHITANAG